ncbi:MAG: helix-turn-helix transcriptional regulator [Actinomycetota bacterium]
MGGSRIIIGPGGTGKTHALQAAVDELTADGASVQWLRGSPGAAVTAADVSAAVDRGTAIAADDVHWFETEAVMALARAVDERIVVASRRPTTDDALIDAIDALDDALGRTQPAERLGLLDLDAFGPALAALRAAVGQGSGGAMASDEVQAVHALTGGSVALAADLLASGWDRNGAPPVEVVDAVERRIRRAGPDAAALLQAGAAGAAVPGTEWSTVIAAVRSRFDVDPDRARRQALAGGMLVAGDDGDRLIPLVQRAQAVALTGDAAAALHDHLGAAAAPVDATNAARHLWLGTGSGSGADVDVVGALVRGAASLSSSEPEESAALIDRAETWGLAPGEAALARGIAAFRAGEADALAHLDQVLRLGQADATDAVVAEAALLAFGLDLRELRFDAAADRQPQGEIGTLLQRLANWFMAEAPESDRTTPSTPAAHMIATAIDGVAAVAEGRGAEAAAAFTAAADDFDRLEPTATIGTTPHQTGALAAIALGDGAAIDALTAQAQAHDSGGAGEAMAHRLLAAYGALMGGDYQPALEALRAADPATSDEPAGEGGDRRTGAASQRDRLLLSAVEAAVARRSGDTGRLRSAWTSATEALLRGSASWLLTDLLVEILTCGARLGDTQRIGPLVDRLGEQAAALPANGPGPVMAAWLRLQLAVAAEDHEGVAAAAATLAALRPDDRRSQSRVAAGAAWAAVVERRAEEATITAVADELLACGDAWEASRLLGQAALDEADPQAARRLLERARATGADTLDEGGDGLAALGLSDREAEVAVLVVEGRTHKEIGAQLYISPKTVEHHVAKIRQKVGASSRAELLSIVREALGEN